MERYQHTLKKQVRLCGVGLHSGNPVTLTVKPASVDHGIRFKLVGNEVSMPAVMDRVVDTRLATTIAEGDMVFSTTEHILAALTGLGIDNALVELDAPEVPIMDGSAGPFVHVLKKANRQRLNSAKRIVKIIKTISYSEGDSVVRIDPYDGLKLSCEINFNHKFINKQKYSIELSPERFANEIASARTFGFIDQVEKLKACGYALGGSLENALVIDADGVINDGGLRFADEFVRHKLLDLIGDMTLLGCSVMGHVVAKRSGHSQHLGLLKAIAAQPDHWQIVEFEEKQQGGVLAKSFNTVQVAANKILPFLVPQNEPLLDGPCSAIA